MNVKRVISLYEKKGDQLLKQLEIDIDQHTLKEIWTPFEDDPMFYMSYPIDANQATIVAGFFGIKIDLNRYDAYLECYAIE